MPSLYNQIEILYKVIGQLEPEPDTSHADHNSTLQNRTSKWFCSLCCLWFSIPLSFWLSSGQIGLTLYWQVLSRVTCLAEMFTHKQRPAETAVAAGKLAAEFCPLEGAAQ
jgi:hypothetical protein